MHFLEIKTGVQLLALGFCPFLIASIQTNSIQIRSKHIIYTLGFKPIKQKRTKYHKIMDHTP